jgi:RimJ/RimL family protein N-acetyltransferase
MDPVVPLPQPDPPLADGAVLLRPWRDADAPGIVAAVADPEIPRWTRVPDGYTLRDALGFLASQEPMRRRGEHLGLALAAPEAPDRVLGSLSLVRLDWPHGRGEIGWWVASEARRRGLATAGARLLSRWALERLGLGRIDCFVDVDNVASQRVAERAGFIRDGVLRSWHEHRGERRSMVCYGLLASDLRRDAGALT